MGLGWSLKSWHFGVLAAAVVGAWLLLRFNIPKEGKQDINLLFSPNGRVLLLVYSLLMVSQLLRFSFEFAGVEKDMACGVALGVFLIAVIPLIPTLVKGIKRRQVAELHGEATANQAWNEGELSSEA